MLLINDNHSIALLLLLLSLSSVLLSASLGLERAFGRSHALSLVPLQSTALFLELRALFGFFLMGAALGVGYRLLPRKVRKEKT